MPKAKIHRCCRINTHEGYAVALLDSRFDRYSGCEKRLKVKNGPFLAKIAIFCIHWIFYTSKLSFQRPRFFCAMRIHHTNCAKKFEEISSASYREKIRQRSKFWLKMPNFTPLSSFLARNIVPGGENCRRTKKGHVDNVRDKIWTRADVDRSISLYQQS